MKRRGIGMKWFVSAFFFAAVLSLLTFTKEAYAAGVDVHVGIGLPFPGCVVSPPVVAYPAPPVVVYERPAVLVPAPYGHYRPHHRHHRYHKKWVERRYREHDRHHRGYRY